MPKPNARSRNITHRGEVANIHLGLQREIVATFLNELRKSGKLEEPVIGKLESMLNEQSVTKEKVLELIRENAALQNKER